MPRKLGEFKMQSDQFSTPEDVLQKFSIEEMIELFREMGYAVTEEEMERLQRRVTESERVEHVIQAFLETRE